MRKRTRIYIMGDPLRWCLVLPQHPPPHHIPIPSKSQPSSSSSYKMLLHKKWFTKQLLLLLVVGSGPCHHPIPVQRRNRASGEILTTCVMAFLFQIPSSSSIVSSRPIKADLRCWALPPCLEMKKTSRRPTESHHHNISSQVLTWIVV